MKRPLTAAEVATALALDADRRERLAAHLDRVRFWQRRMNLVAPSTLDDAWRRHVLDSAQLVRWLPPEATTLIDLGSGAGFPGLVLAILTNLTVTLVESDGRKAAFLLDAARACDVAPRVLNQRIESLRGERADVVTARALAPLPRLLAHARPLLAEGGRCLLLKGGSVDDELTEAGKTWRMTVERFPSIADARGCVLRIGDLERQDGR